MIERLMLKREHFPLELLDYYGLPFRNPTIIPPFHRHIVENGIDLELAIEVIDEALQATLLDLKEYNLINDNDKTKQLSYAPPKINEERVFFPEFPFIKSFHVQRDKISPYGTDHYVMINKNFPVISYTVPRGLKFTPELMAEYGMARRDLEKTSSIRCVCGWSSHNVGPRDVFYKNFMIALNNAVVRKTH